MSLSLTNPFLTAPREKYDNSGSPSFDTSPVRQRLDFDAVQTSTVGHDNDIKYSTRSFVQPHTVQPFPINISKFNGYPHEDPIKFLSDFKALMQLQGLDLNDTADSSRLLAAFSLYLSGPAHTWFEGQDFLHGGCWNVLEKMFRASYINNSNNNASLYIETRSFNTLALQPGMLLEDFYGLILKKGHRLEKSPMDMMTQFIDGLPDQLQFFVRVSRPKTIEEAFQSARMGEAYNFRGDKIPLTPKQRLEPTTAQTVTIDVLSKQVEQLSKQVENLSSVSNQCQLCQQFGHKANDCFLHYGAHTSAARPPLVPPPFPFPPPPINSPQGGNPNFNPQPFPGNNPNLIGPDASRRGRQYRV